MSNKVNVDELGSGMDAFYAAHRGPGPGGAPAAAADPTARWTSPTATPPHESVTGYDRPGYFAYRVSDFDNVIGRLATDARGRWWFTDGPHGSTHSRWTYTFNSRNPLTAMMLLPIVKILWRGFMRRAITTLSELAVADAETFRADAGN